MYARIVQFTMGPGTRATADALREQFSQALKNSEGVVKIYFMGDDETGTYSTMALWESKEAGEAAFKKIQPRLIEALGGLVEKPPQSQYFEIIETIEPA